jgi:hypothetical protein
MRFVEILTFLAIKMMNVKKCIFPYFILKALGIIIYEYLAVLMYHNMFDKDKQTNNK